MKKAKWIFLTFFAMVLIGLQSASAQSLVDGGEAAKRVATAIATMESNMDAYRQNNLAQSFLVENARHIYYSGVLLALKHQAAVSDAIQAGNVVLPGQEEDAMPSDRTQITAIDTNKKQYVKELETLLKP